MTRERCGTAMAASRTRRQVVAALAAGAALAGAPPLAAQQAARVARVGYLSPGWPGSAAGLVDAFRSGLRDAGWIEGRNAVIEYRYAEGRIERLPELAAELVRLRVDVIVAAATAASLAASRATTSIPVVMVSVGDPVRLGLIDNLARPGGNLTGVSYSVGLESIPKGLELLKQALPAARRVAILSNPANPAQAIAVDDVEKMARSLGLQLELFEARSPAEIDAAFAAIGGERFGALFVVAESSFRGQRSQLAALAAKHRLPTVYGMRENVEAGGLMSYGPSLVDQARRGAAYVDRILRGVKPGELPVEQPTKFELVINLKTAKALGLSIPQPLLLRADELID